MELTTEFEIEADLATAWMLMAHAQWAAGCIPGAEIEEVHSETEYGGRLQLALGEIEAVLRGGAEFVEIRPADHVFVIRAAGRDTGGKGNAAATITTSMLASSAGTRVAVSADVQLTGVLGRLEAGALGEATGEAGHSLRRGGERGAGGRGNAAHDPAEPGRLIAPRPAGQDAGRHRRASRYGKTHTHTHPDATWLRRR